MAAQDSAVHLTALFGLDATSQALNTKEFSHKILLQHAGKAVMKNNNIIYFTGGLKKKKVKQSIR